MLAALSERGAADKNRLFTQRRKGAKMAGVEARDAPNASANHLCAFAPLREPTF
jgi:hypothetical protein